MANLVHGDYVTILRFNVNIWSNCRISENDMIFEVFRFIFQNCRIFVAEAAKMGRFILLKK
jgi:hypothetical protein